MSEKDKTGVDKPVPRAKQAPRWPIGIGIALLALVGLFWMSRLAIRIWSQSRLEADAPRIAFSLDNTLLGEIGITDATYEQAMTRAGGRLIRLRPDMAGSPKVDPEAVEALLDEKEIDGVLLTGGGDIDPELYGGDTDNTLLVHRLRDDFEIALIRAANERGLPILGICRGCQILNVALGGTLRSLRGEKELIKSHLTLTGHSVELASRSKLAGALEVVRLDDAISLHGQAVDRPGEGLKVVGVADGGVAEAIEADADIVGAWMIGIQWHPELAPTDEVQNRLFRTFVHTAGEARNRRIGSSLAE